jgi:hypothetical protein
LDEIVPCRENNVIFGIGNIDKKTVAEFLLYTLGATVARVRFVDLSEAERSNGAWSISLPPCFLNPSFTTHSPHRCGFMAKPIP